ncbi:hypothetical protein [Burkholderia reimsis]|uniref:hypothetical protein n=1 Tax=Burkholderia reimsis TaxID=2234132 RepID=UPI001403F101|nr:hypothetical protein [Burkholderia reimsis]
MKGLIKGPLQVTLLLVGVAVFVLGCGTPDKLPVIGGFRSDHPIPMMILGAVLTITGIGWHIVRTMLAHSEIVHRRNAHTSKGPLLPKAADFDIRIVSHPDGAYIDEDEQKFRGTIKRAVPDGYAIWLVRRWKSAPDLYYPEGRADLRPMSGSTAEHEWEVEKVFVGGNPGGKDARIIEMWLVGPDGQIMLDAVKKANSKYASLMSHTKTPWEQKWLIAPLGRSTSDMVLGTRITLTRR